jgi:hypothetical protein
MSGETVWEKCGRVSNRRLARRKGRESIRGKVAEIVGSVISIRTNGRRKVTRRRSSGVHEMHDGVHGCSKKQDTVVVTPAPTRDRRVPYKIVGPRSTVRSAVIVILQVVWITYPETRTGLFGDQE